LGTRTCTPAVTQECVVTGFRNLLCLEKSVAQQLYPSGVAIAVPNDPLPDACYRCIDQGHCSSNGTQCKWTYSVAACINECIRSAANDSCWLLNPCDCLSEAACSWCQYGVTVSSTGSTTNTVINAGVCMRNTVANKCEAQYEAGGYEGNLITAKPPACTDSTVSPQLVNPAAVITDAKVKIIASSILSGGLRAIDIQIKLGLRDVTDVIVKEVISITSATATVSVTITFDITSTRTSDEVVVDINQAVSDHLEVDISAVASTASVIVTGQSNKRSIEQSSTGNGLSYTSQTDVSSPGSSPSGGTPGSSPSGAYFIAPSVWLVSLFLVFLKGSI